MKTMKRAGRVNAPVEVVPAQDALKLLLQGEGWPGMRVMGALQFPEGAENVQLPSGLHAELLDFSQCKEMDELPSGLSCFELNLSGTQVHRMPADLAVESILRLAGCEELVELPAGLTVGSLDLRGCRSLAALPEGLDVWFLDMTGCWNFRTWPTRAKIRSGRLTLRGCTALAELPAYLGPLAALNLRDCPNLRALPDSLRITGWIDVAQSGLADLRSVPRALRGVALRWQGVAVDERIVFQPQTITLAEILAETNAERRRVLIDRFGVSRFMGEANAQVLDTDEDRGGPRRLLRLELGEDEPLVTLHCFCPRPADNISSEFRPIQHRVIRRRRGSPASTIPANISLFWKPEQRAGETMTISEHAEEFYGRRIKEFEGEDDWEGPDFAYRICIDWEAKPGMLEAKFDELIACEGAKELEALVIGAWHFFDDVGSSSELVIKLLVDRRKKLSALKALFLGDITYEENEISWIQQSNVSSLLEAFPKLEVFRVRGGTGLAFTPLQHKTLTHLIIETGGLPRSVIREICQCKFPNLQHLELWLGVEEYGFDGGIEDLQPLLTGKLFPKLTYLGLRNTGIVDEIAPVVVNAPILQRLRILDLSYGTLSDAGAQALLNLPPDLSLEELNLTHHYMTEKMVKRLRKTLKCRVIADDGQNPNEEWRSVVVSE